MSGIIDFFLIIFLLILTVYIIISNITSILDNRLNILKNDFVKIKCYSNTENSNNEDSINNPDNSDNSNNSNNADNNADSNNADNNNVDDNNVDDNNVDNNNGNNNDTDNTYNGDDDVYNEKFGSLPNNIINRKDIISGYIANKSNPSTEELLGSIIDDEDISKIEDPNYNTFNNLPYIIDPQNVNEGYYYNRVKLVTNPDSPLLKKAIKNMKKIDTQLKNCANKNLTNMRKVNGFNNYENLSEDSYANITSIGKSLLTPYTSYPLPS